ncbi:MAG TPA: gliding motility-associated C-terminal domain-containing protein, partial [Chitinophagales bacterium]|nr:gliding motility-associated C-terminal domain-containing protein [Chitinophagales bacterium]
FIQGTVNSVNLNQWYHLALTADNVELKFYINGDLVGTLPTGFSLNYGTDDLAIGNATPANSWSGFFNGDVDEVRIWNTVRTQSQIQSTMATNLVGNEGNLVTYYKMDEVGQGSGITVNNSQVTGSVLNGLTFGVPCSSPVFTILASPTITSLSNSSGIIGSTVTITGTNFSTTPANNIVKFNGTTATVSAASASSLTVTVPAGALSGPITVTLGCFTATSSAFLVTSGVNQLFYNRTDGTIWSTAGNGSADQFITNGYWPRVSPDGRFMLFHRGASATITNKNVFIRDLQTGIETLVFTNNDFVVFYSWSQDASKIYFDYGCNLWTMNRDGSNVTSIQGANCFDDAPDIRYSDGKIVFHNQNGLLLINNDGSGRTPVPNTTAFDYWPAWSPDGQWITFSRYNSSSVFQSQYKIREDGSNLTLLYSAAAGETFSSINGTFTAWSNDGLNIILSGTVDCRTGLFAIAADGSLAIKRVNTTFTTSGPEFTGNFVGNPVLNFLPLYQLPTITSFLPIGGAVGITVTITGNNFSTTPANNVVKFNGVAATASASTSTTITVTVPAGATTGTISVTTCGTAISSGSFTLCTTPSPPTVPDVNRCGTGNILITATGAVATEEYRWYNVVSGGVSLANTATYNPSLTATITYYVSVIQPAGGCESTRTPVIATINALPPAPVTTLGSSCAPSATVTVTASGGNAGQYRWYNVATGGTAVAGEVNATYTTPLLTVTTTYFVAINNGICESLRVPVTAEIKNCSPQITTASLTTTLGGQALVNLVPMIATFNNPLDINSLVVITPPPSGALVTFTGGVLKVDYTNITFSGSEKFTIRACDVAGHCSQQDFTVTVDGSIVVFNAISPNNDQKNESMVIQNIDLLPEAHDNHVYIFDRWGSLVWDIDNYNNNSRAFIGLGNSGSELGSGTYYYKIEFKSGLNTMTGFISLRR